LHISDNNLPNASMVQARFVERLIRGICHDFAAPNRHIIQYSQMITRADLADGLQDKHHRWLSSICDSAHLMQAMLASLASLTRLSVQRDKKSTFSLEDLFASLCAVYMQGGDPILGRNVVISCNDDWPEIRGSEEHWVMLMSSLLSNAVTYHSKAPDHEVHVFIECYATEDNKVHFGISDNGIGATEYQFSEMGKPFKRLNRPDEYPGIGMGLTYCEFITELNSGELEFCASAAGGLSVSYRQTVEKVVGARTPPFKRVAKDD